MTARPARQRKNAQKIAVAMACLALATFIGFRGSERGLRSPPPETVAFTGDPLGAPAVEYSSPVMADVPERTEPSALTPLRSTGAPPPAPEDSESGQENG